MSLIGRLSRRARRASLAAGLLGLAASLLLTVPSLMDSFRWRTGPFQVAEAKRSRKECLSAVEELQKLSPKKSASNSSSRRLPRESDQEGNESADELDRLIDQVRLETRLRELGCGAAIQQGEQGCESCFEAELERARLENPQKPERDLLEALPWILAAFFMPWGGFLGIAWAWQYSPFREFLLLAIVGFALFLFLRVPRFVADDEAAFGLLTFTVFLPLGVMAGRRWWHSYGRTGRIENRPPETGKGNEQEGK